MQRAFQTIASIAILAFSGCVSEKHGGVQKNYFLFHWDPRDGCWRSRYDDFVEMAKAYAVREKIPFNFEGTSASLKVFDDKGVLLARIEFGTGPGSPVLAVDIDGNGRAIRHQTGTWYHD